MMAQGSSVLDKTAKAYYDTKFQDYSGKLRFVVNHPSHAADELIVAAPTWQAALVAAADRWGERWQALNFYAYCTVDERK